MSTTVRPKSSSPPTCHDPCPRVVAKIVYPVDGNATTEKEPDEKYSCHAHPTFASSTQSGLRLTTQTDAYVSASILLTICPVPDFPAPAGSPAPPRTRIYVSTGTYGLLGAPSRRTGSTEYSKFQHAPEILNKEGNISYVFWNSVTVHMPLRQIRRA